MKDFDALSKEISKALKKVVAETTEENVEKTWDVLLKYCGPDSKCYHVCPFFSDQMIRGKDTGVGRLHTYCKIVGTIGMEPPTETRLARIYLNAVKLLAEIEAKSNS